VRVLNYVRVSGLGALYDPFNSSSAAVLGAPYGSECSGGYYNFKPPFFSRRVVRMSTPGLLKCWGILGFYAA